jgi:hypothetical protein
LRARLIVDLDLFYRSAIKYIHELTAENERLRAENIRQSKELGEQDHSDRQLSSSVEVAITGDETEGTVPKEEVPCKGK